MPIRHHARSLDVVLTAGCNLSCSYCYQNDKKASERMKWGTLRRSIDLLLDSRQREVTLGFYGGEPLLRFESIRRAVRYAERKRRAGQIVRYAIITNGTLLREEQAEFMARHSFETQISFDGLPGAQDERGPKTFGILDALLDRLRVSHPVYFTRNVHVSMTLLPRTIGHLADSVGYFIDKQVARVRFSPQIGCSADWQVERIDGLDRQFKRILERCVALYEETGRVPVEAFRKEKTGDAARRARSVCGAPSGDALAVDVDGRVSGCVMFAESYQKFATKFVRDQLVPMRIGNIRGPGLGRGLKAYRRTARSAEIFRHKQNKRSSYGRCDECRHFDQCTVCPVSIGNIPGNTDPHRVPDFICAYNLVVNKYRERFPVQPGTVELLEGRLQVPRLMRELDAYVRVRAAAE